MSTSSARGRSRPLVRGALVVVFFGLALVLAGVFFLRQQLEPVNANSAQTTEFEILPGWGASRVSQELAETGLVRNARFFSLWLRYEGTDTQIGEGLYTLSPAMSAHEIAEALEAGGRPRVTKVTIPEGFRSVRVAARLSEAGFGAQEAFVARIVSPDDLRPSFVPEGVGLEGYLFPASYEFPVNSTLDRVLQLMVRRFERELTPDVRQQLEAMGLSAHEWVTLASIIQAEAGNHAEMPIIAGVFLNRLDDGMPLQSDPTVAYGLGKRLPELDRSAGDFEAAHLWNTYTQRGLPPSPIGNPGRAALRAVFAPQRVNADNKPYLYFLHGRGGEFRPNVTFEAHNRDIQEFLR